MVRRLVSLLLATLIFLLSGCGFLKSSSSGTTSGKKLDNTTNNANAYILQILFGNDSERRSSDKNAKALLCAVYLCCEQTGEDGNEQLRYLKKAGVSVPELAELRIKQSELVECAHRAWEYEFTAPTENQNNRKKLLRKTVNVLFDFGLVNNLFNEDEGKCNSFAALLYYFHCLADYLSDDQSATEINIGGTYVPPYAGQPSVVINGGVPDFSESEKNQTESFVRYSGLDNLGRAGVVFANIGPEDLPPEGSQGSADSIKPSGYNLNKYDGIVNSSPPYVYNRCHLLAHSLGGKDKEEINLVTGTRYMNVNGMEPFEKDIRSYIKKTNNHVLYRVTPVFTGDNLLVSGVQIEAYSVEDSGKKQFNVYCYNIQPGISLNYADGNNEQSDFTIDRTDILPFALFNANANNTDLILEISRYLEVLFEDQKNSTTYREMMNKISLIASKARNINSTEGEASRYIETKEYEYQYVNVLKSYIPLLLRNEKFFKEVFH